MKIVQIITGSSSFGGAEAHVRDLAVGLRLRGHDCVVLVGPPNGLLHDQLLTAGVPFVIIPALRKPIHPVWDPISFCQILRVLWRMRPDVIATHTSKAGFVGRAAAKLLGIPSFFTPHGLSFIDRKTGTLIPFRLFLEKIALCLGSRQIAVCNAERQLAIRWLAIDQKNISTIHNGLPSAIPTRKRTTDRVVITMVARFDVQKDHATLLKALATLCHLEWELCLAGDGPLLSSVREMAREYGLSSRIDFRNQCSDVPTLLAMSDIFVLSSNWEAFPISILEAMRAGLPVLATDTGGVLEAVEDQENGFLFDRHDHQQLATHLSALVLSPDLRRDMGSKSQLRFELNFEWRHMLDKTETLYASALRGRPRPVLIGEPIFATPVRTGDPQPGFSLFSGLRSGIMDSFLPATQGKRWPASVPSTASGRRPGLSAITLLLLDCVGLSVALWSSLLIEATFGRPPGHNVVLQLCLIIAVAIVAMAMCGLYPALGASGFIESKYIVRSISFVINGNFLLFCIMGAQQYQLSLIFLFWILAISLVLLGRSTTRAFLSRQPWWGESVVLIGSGDQMDEVAELLRGQNRLGLHIGAIFTEDGGPGPPLDVPAFSSVQSATAFCIKAKIQTAIVILQPDAGLTMSGARSRYAAYFPNLIVFPIRGARRTAGSRSQILTRQLSMEASLVSVVRNRRRLKRCIDFVMALCATILLAPLLLAIAVAVKVTSPGPILFGHRRIGRYGKPFRAWKFRTMVVDAEVHLAERLAASPELRAEWERDHKLRNDPRVTKIGAFLRKYSLDELPQLWNALCSEMSIVGPRPIIADEIAKYSDSFHCYCRVLPGITGLWQISGRNETTYDERVELDTYYVNSWSLWLDLYIIGRSFRTVLNGRGAY